LVYLWHLRCASAKYADATNESKIYGSKNGDMLKTIALPHFAQTKQLDNIVIWKPVLRDTEPFVMYFKHYIDKFYQSALTNGVKSFPLPRRLT